MHILKSQQFSRPLLEAVVRRANDFEVLWRSSSGRYRMRQLFSEKMLFNSFETESVRTHASFCVAGLRLGMDVPPLQGGGRISSEYRNRGESLEDHIKVLNTMGPDVIVLRRPEEGAATVSRVPIINAGDGKGQHPTQAVLDVGTIHQKFGAIDGLSIIIGGDLANGRTARSLAYLLAKFKDVKIMFVSPPELRMKSDVLEYLDKYHVTFTEHEVLEEVIAESKVIYWTRSQHEKADGRVVYEDIERRYCIDAKMMERMQPDAILMHPLPRNEEIHHEVDSDPRAHYFRQTEYSVPIRMALLELALGGNSHAESLAEAA